MMIEPNQPQNLYALQKGITNDDVYFTSFHNRQGVKTDLAIIFLLEDVTLQASFIYDSHWWQLSKQQKSYTRKLTCEIGVSVNLTPTKRTDVKMLYY